jgi:hypothetical protein
MRGPLWLVRHPNYIRVFDNQRAARDYLRENYPDHARDFWGGSISRDDIPLLRGEGVPVYDASSDRVLAYPINLRKD